MTSDLALLNTSQVSQLLQSLPGIVFIRAGNTDKTMRFLSEGCLRLTEYPASTLCESVESNLSFNRIILPEDFIELSNRIDNAIETCEPYSAEYRIQTKSGTQRWFLEQGTVYKSEADVYLEGLITEISAQKLTQFQLQQDAFYDKLTGLPNRSLFIDRLGQSVRRGQREGNSQFAVLFLDLDRFKVINDSLGHAVGDMLLTQVAQRLQNCVRPGDTVARLGGDEFTILLAEIGSLVDVIQVTERILKDMSAPFLLENQEIFTTTSIGIALSSSGYSYPEDLIRDADIALYQAKASGKACYALFQPGMHIHAVARLQMENDLRRAIQRQEFCLLFQPIVSMETGTLAGMETFVYWQHPTRGLLAPGEFLPIAEETGLMIPIGQWVLQTACTQMSQWHQSFPAAHLVFISVNLSSLEMMHPDLVAFLQTVLQETELNPLRLKLEMTESTLMQHSESVLLQLQHIKALGVQLCIDDFGTGYSALSYLDQFPIDYLKIDRSFIARADAPEQLEIVRTILSLAASLGLQAVAEGVETKAQLAQLRALQCEFGQGYTFARPMEAFSMQQFLEEQFSGDALTSITVALPRLSIRTQAGCYQVLLIGRMSWSLGRSQDSTLFLADRLVSRDHAMILQLARSAEFYLVDLGSRNGSFINQQRVKGPTHLANGDLIRMGRTELQYWAAAATPARQGVSVPNRSLMMHQPSTLQGQIWREVLIAQEVSVIWLAHQVNVRQTLHQIDAAGEPLPSLLLLDVSSIEGPLIEFFNWLQQRYETIPVILTQGDAVEISESQRQQAIDAGALDLLPGFQLRGSDLLSHSADVAQKVAGVLQILLDQPPNTDAILDAAIAALQLILRNETLF
ncbi:MAG: EAL domain-containing protein [Thermosynechococcaceae cyanobacterium]